LKKPIPPETQILKEGANPSKKQKQTKTTERNSMKKIFNDIITKNILKFVCYHPLISITIFIFILELFLFNYCVYDINNIKI
jgi:hypothetical protein